MVRKALLRMGYPASSIVEASDGLEALQKAEEHDSKIDIVLTDWNMPNMDGLSLLRRLQESEQLRRIPVIMVTGEAERNRVIEAIREGARNYIVKPFTAETLRQKVLAIEMELIGRSQPTNTAVMRIRADKDGEGATMPFVAQLPEELVAGLFENAKITEHPAGRVLVKLGEGVEQLHIINRGVVEIAAAGGGQEPKVRRRGDCVGELFFLSGDPADRTARAETDVVLASVEKEDFEDLLAEYPHLSFYLTRLLARRSRTTEQPGGSGSGLGLSGKLSMMALAELVQTLHSMKKTGQLRVGNGEEEGKIFFSEGEVRQASLGDTSGEEAFYQLLTWAEGSFVFEAGCPDFEPGIYRATMSLLMEGMRRQDELKRMRAELPA